MAKQAIKKGAGIQKRGLSAWKERNGMVIEKPKEGEVIKQSELVTSSANKEQKWLIMPKAFQDVLKINIPLNTVIGLRGHSNTSKSTLMNHALAAAQKQGLIPVIFDTENAFSFQYAKAMGFEAEPVYGDVEHEYVDDETGEITTEVKREIINWEGNFIYYNNKILAERFGDIDYSQGKRVAKKRTVAVIEDIAYAINELLDAQEAGEIEQGFLICWDSVGSLSCYKGYTSGKIANAMWDAAAISQAFSNIVNNRIPSSKKVSCPYDNGFIYVNKVWMDSMSNPTGPAQQKPKGGASLEYASRLIIQVGKSLSAGIKRLSATSKGLNYYYGIQTSLKVLKNHLDAPNNVTYEGNIVATDTGYIGVDELDSYKKTHVSRLLKELNKLADGKVEINADDIDFVEEEVDD